MGSFYDAFKKASDNFKSQAVVRKSGNQWCVFSKDGEKLECFNTKKEAQDRLAEIEFFSHQDKE